MMRSMYSGVSGLGAHQDKMDVVGNNIANVNTVGYKGSSVNFQEMLSQTLQGAMAPQGGRGGMNPQQIGLGTSVGSISTNTEQGNLQSTGNNTDLAIEGNGYFVANDGTQDLYTRAGNLSLDEDGNLVNGSTGNIVQGWEADESGDINTETEDPGDLQIPIGDEMRGEATTDTSFKGNLDARELGGDSRNVNVDVFNSQGDKHTMTLDFERQLDGAPSDSITIDSGDLTASLSVDRMSDLSTNQDSREEVQGEYELEITDAFDNNNDDGETVTLEDEAGNTYDYEYQSDGSADFEGDNIEDQTDSLADAINSEGRFNASADNDVITITEATGEATGEDIDTIDVGGGDFAANLDIIEESTAEQTGDFEFDIIDQFKDGESIEIDGETLEYQSDGSADFDGDTIEEQADSLAGAIGDITRWDDTDTEANNDTITMVEDEGEATGDEPVLAVETLDGDNEAEMKELNGLNIEFGEDNDDELEVEYDESNNKITVNGDWDDSAGEQPADLADIESEINNALDTEQITGVQLADSGLNIEDLEDAPSLTLESAANAWDWQVSEVSDADSSSIQGSGEVSFNADGSFDTMDTDDEVSFEPRLEAETAELDLDLSSLTQSAADYSLEGSRNDGYEMGSLDSFSFDEAGTITGTYSNGFTKPLGQLAMARFSNPGGLDREGDTMFNSTQNSGEANIGEAGSEGRGVFKPSTLEMSNVDLSEQFTEMITSQRGFQANSKAITTSDEMLQELVNLKR
ncbi:MAG: flagellar hook-basal body complex protein [Bacillota bacterium]